MESLRSALTDKNLAVSSSAKMISDLQSTIDALKVVTTISTLASCIKSI